MGSHRHRATAGQRILKNQKNFYIYIHIAARPNGAMRGS
jgi:hypothetical protein